MSGTMTIRFAPDMPIASVEVLSPDLEPVAQVCVQPGTESKVEVPSEASFIRIHAPSGRTITVRHDGNLDYFITRDLLQGAAQGRKRSWARPISTVQGIRGYTSSPQALAPGGVDLAVISDLSGSASGPLDPRPALGLSATLHSRIDVSASPGGGSTFDGTRSADGRQINFRPHPQETPYQLRVRAGQTELSVLLPGSLDAAYVRSDDVGEGGRIISVRVSTKSDGADTVGGYLARANFYAAETMASWADQAEAMLFAKGANPYAATIGGYLLLRLEDYGSMRDWAKNLAARFPYLPDGCVIWAWQSLQERADQETATKYFLEAAGRGLPIFTEGLRLLSQGLRLIGAPGENAMRELTGITGRVVWNSPFSATTTGSPASGPPISFDIGYIPVV